MLNVQPRGMHPDIPDDIITKVLFVCGKAVHYFELNAHQETSFCRTTDLEQLRKRLHECSYFLYTSLWSVESDMSNSVGSY
jgi:hypothetical protein